MKKTVFGIDTDTMADKVLKFERYARETRKALTYFEQNPQDKTTQLELFRVLQVTGLLYKQIIREFGSSYGCTVDELRETARDAMKYLPRNGKMTTLLQDIRHYLTILSKTPSRSNGRRSLASREGRFGRAAG